MNKLDHAETRINELEARIPDIVTTALVTALRDPEVLQQLRAMLHATVD
jgi:hypothetical protein